MKILEFGNDSGGTEAALGPLGPLDGGPIAAILAGGTGASLAFLVPEHRLGQRVPELHRHCVERVALT